jgi:signal transduction histidine kinase
MLGIGLLLFLLIVIQVGWLNKVRAMERKDTDARIQKALDKTAQQLENNINCFEAYTKFYVNPTDRFYLVKQVNDTARHSASKDTMTIVYNPSGMFPDTAILTDRVGGFSFPVLAEVQFNFHIPFSEAENQSLQKNAVLDTEKAHTYKDIIRNKLGIASLLNTGLADSLLHRNLEEQHISGARFGYGFTDGTSQSTAFAKRVADTGVFLKSPYSVTLFRNNQFLRPYKMSVVFMDLDAGNGFVWWLLLSIGIILLLSVAFLLFTRLFLRQRRLSEMKSDFINNLTHEFNTPMANIALAVETLNSNGLHDQKVSRILNIISSESYRLRENIERTLQVATIDQGRMRLQKETIDLVQLISTMLEGYQSQCEQHGGHISFEHGTRAVVYGDEVHLLNCLCNLLDNAIRYRKGPPLIIISLQEVSDDVILTVSDNGIGMNADTQRHIFEKFYRAHQGDVHNTKGFGLGLNYVKGIISLHGGRINVRSKLGEGSTFIIHLPKATYVNN